MCRLTCEAVAGELFNYIINAHRRLKSGSGRRLFAAGSAQWRDGEMRAEAGCCHPVKWCLSSVATCSLRGRKISIERRRCAQRAGGQPAGGQCAPVAPQHQLHRQRQPKRQLESYSASNSNTTTATANNTNGNNNEPKRATACRANSPMRRNCGEAIALQPTTTTNGATASCVANEPLRR